MTFYKRQWQQLLEFAEERGEACYSERLGIDFLEKKFNILEKDFEGVLIQSEVQNLRVIRMLGDFQLHGTVLRRYYKHKEILHNQYFINIINNFKKYCINQDYSPVTLEHYTKQSANFLDYADSHRITSCDEIDLTLINNYIKTLSGYSYKTVEQQLCSMRAFFKYLYMDGLAVTDYSLKIPMIQSRKQTRIPSVWSVSDLKRLIAAIDRGSPIGKRDYAIILLACRLGLRVSDIKRLTFENFHWENKQLVFVQSKTRTSVSLPLLKDVGWAVIDYLKYGRPNVDTTYVFIRHLAPFLPFSEDDHLSQMIIKYMRLAHIPVSSEKRVGMHSLRHTLASLLLENDTPLPVISDILGHVDTESTAVYLKVTIGNIYKNFRKFLWRAGISHGGKGSGPRIHDFRHTFAVNCLKKWSLEGKDLMSYLPILRIYLGHDSYEDTAYYLRLTADVFPNITIKLETAYSDLIPVMEGGSDETY